MAAERPTGVPALGLRSVAAPAPLAAPLPAPTAAPTTIETDGPSPDAHPGVPLDLELLESRHWVADIVYRPIDTELVRGARARGCEVLDGGRMAVGHRLLDGHLDGVGQLVPTPADQLDAVDWRIRQAAGLGSLSPDFRMKGRFDEIYPAADVCVIFWLPAGS